MAHVTRLAALLILATPATWADSSDPLRLRISSETAPPGGLAQIKLFAERPVLVTQGSLKLDFDPAVFGDVVTATVFSATGDAAGAATVKGRHIDLQFVSDSGGVGQLPELPVAVIAVPVLAEAAPGATAAITAEAGNVEWRGGASGQYTISVTPGEFVAGGKLSVSRVRPGGGLLPAGTLVRIEGTGFTRSTEVAIEDVSLASVQFFSQEEVDLTLAAPAELTGKRLRVRNPDGEEIAHYSWLRSEAPEGEIPIFPLRTYAGASVIPGGPSFQRGFAIQNPNLGPIEVTLANLDMMGRVIVDSRTAPIASGESYVTMATGSRYSNKLFLTSPDPVRVIEFYRYYYQAPRGGFPAQPDAMPKPALGATGSMYVTWQVGAPPPAPQTLHVAPLWADQVGFSVSTSAPWLIAPARATAPSDVAVQVNPAGLTPGEYQATITLTPDSGADPSVTTVLLRVKGLLADLQFPYFQVNRGDPPPAPQSVRVTSAAGPAQFSVEVTTDKGGRWLSVSPDRGTTPATLTLAVNPAGLDYGGYTGIVKIKGPVDVETLYVTLSIPYPPGYGIGINSEPLVYSLKEGSAAPPARVVAVYPGGVAFDLETKTASGGGWLHAVKIIEGQSSSLSITIDPALLGAGEYHGTVTVTRGEARSDLPVALWIWNSPPRINAVLESDDFRCDTPITTCGILKVTSTGIPVEFEATSDQLWLGVGGGPRITPATLGIMTTGSAVLPGIYHGKVTVAGPGNSLEFPVTLTLPNSPSTRPTIAAVLNGASLVPGPVAAGETVTIFGFNLGPAPSAENSTRVLADGVEAKLLYASPTQVNAVLPPQAAGKRDVVVEVEYNGALSGEAGLPIATAAPGIFTQDSSEVGAAAVLNEDNSLNTPETPALRGAAVQIFGTGVSGAAVVTIGGLPAQVFYSGAAPTFVGLDQVNAFVPREVAAGPAVPILITVEGRRSQPNVFIAVE